MAESVEAGVAEEEVAGEVVEPVGVEVEVVGVGALQEQEGLVQITEVFQHEIHGKQSEKEHAVLQIQ